MKTLSREADLIQMQQMGDLARADNETLKALKHKYDTVADAALWIPDYALVRRDALDKSNRINDILQARIKSFWASPAND